MCQIKILTSCRSEKSFKCLVVKTNISLRVNSRLMFWSRESVINRSYKQQDCQFVQIFQAYCQKDQNLRMGQTGGNKQRQGWRGLVPRDEI